MKRTAEQLTEKKHHYELEREPETTVLLASHQSGLGSASCGPTLDPSYSFRDEDFTCSFTLRPATVAELDPFRELRRAW